MYDHCKIEQEILGFWKKKKIFEKLRKKNSKGKPWSFIDGPMTANNQMGVHHVWGRTYKDAYQRFKAMQGYKQRWQNGFDCQGLWVEVEAEKEIGLNSKKEIEKYGLDKFSKYCRDRVYKYTKILTDQSIRLGQWNDWKNSYYTLTDENIEHIWLFLKTCHDKKWLYKGHNVQPWCYRCGTSVSQHEMADSYEELTHTSLYLKFPIIGKENEFILVWTTTPWTLTTNISAAVHPDLDYVKVKKDNEIYYLSEGTLSAIGQQYKIIEKLKGKDLVGLRYEGPFDGLKAQKGIKHEVVPWKDVGEEEGTGIVHIAPGCGAEDFQLGKKLKLPALNPIDEEGHFLPEYGFLAGKNVADTTDEIINHLGAKDFIFKTKAYQHRYPTCWRCKTELVFRLVDSWFISVKQIRPLMKKAAKKVKFYPEFASKNMQDWLTNMQDWSISRKRYWGLPLPIWECECGEQIFISSKKELQKKAIQGIKQLKELHKPWIDNVKIKCPKCKKLASRVPEVGDCWLDAGIVPYSTLKYMYDKKYWKTWFPAEFVTEMREQTRLWFYSLLFMSVTLENQPPYKKILVYEKVNDEVGRPMHKSWGNSIWFDEGVEKIGADVMRWLYATHNPSTNVNFGFKLGADVKNKLVMLYNLTRYVKQAVPNLPKKTTKLEVEDQWILSKLNSLIKEVTENLDNLKPHIASTAIENFFIYDFSRGYIQFVRERIQNPKGENKKGAEYCLYKVLTTLLKLMSPFVPFITEEIYQKNFLKLEKKESIHLHSWPKLEKTNKKLEEEMSLAQEAMQAILAAREKEKLNVRWPLALAEISVKDAKVKKAIKKLSSLIKRQTNIRKIKFTDLKKGLDFKQGKLKIDTNLTLELEKEGFTREVTRRIQQMRKNLGLKKGDKIELAIVSDYNLKDWEKEIAEITSSKKISFEKTKKYKKEKSFTIRDKEFNICINVL